MVSDAKLQEHVIPAMNAKGRGGEAGARLNTRPIDYCLLYASHLWLMHGSAAKTNTECLIHSPLCLFNHNHQVAATET